MLAGKIVALKADLNLPVLSAFSDDAAWNASSILAGYLAIAPAILLGEIF
jgi:hypothetical protein